ncbi:uncharacterized protein LOC116345583 [Contarinia nasturtii]|uniref:uncharacterized protein LOC116345583 n=1 Tax=Contarinia nasturtii TaxID=265458 RepID=UPI0012D4AF95|nr:uncharacterized protein LOC116345583 [Contarinia nasturtii]
MYLIVVHMYISGYADKDKVVRFKFYCLSYYPLYCIFNILGVVRNNLYLKEKMGAEDDISSESVEALKERLASMKRLMADKQAAAGSKGASVDEILFNKSRRNAVIIDANFLSIALCGALGVILSVAVYAFYSLYNAVSKRFPSSHTEL